MTLPRWKNFNEWRAEYDPNRELTAHQAVEAYEMWKDEWRFEVSDMERIKQTITREP